MIIRPASVVANSGDKLFYIYTKGKKIIRITNITPYSSIAMASQARDILPRIRYAGNTTCSNYLEKFNAIYPEIKIQSIKKESRRGFFERTGGEPVVYDLSRFYSQINKIGLSGIEMTFKYARDHKIANYYTAVSNGKTIRLCMPDFEL